MRLFLAIKGYRQIFDVLTAETADKTGAAALRAMALASQAYAKERPGLSAATFRCPMIESPEWMAAFMAVRRLFENAFAECGLDDVAPAHAIRILRSLVRGFVINEMRALLPHRRTSASPSTSLWMSSLAVCRLC